jgi:TrmH family RNA methyltransferase
MTSPIASRRNKRVKDAAKLRDARQRRKQGRIVIDGLREIRRAIESGVKPIEAFVDSKSVETETTSKLVETLSAAGAEILIVTSEVYEKLAFGSRDEGAVVTAELPRRELSDLTIDSQSPLVAVVEALEKPGNVGAVFRSADGAGRRRRDDRRPGTDLFNPNTIRASLGTVFGHNLCTASTEETIDWLEETAFRPSPPARTPTISTPGPISRAAQRDRPRQRGPRALRRVGRLRHRRDSSRWRASPTASTSPPPPPSSSTKPAANGVFVSGEEPEY